MQENYEAALYYPEDLYEEYEKAAKEMIRKNKYDLQYFKYGNLYIEDGYVTLTLEVGEKGKKDYIIATVKKYGTNGQSATFKRSRKSAEEAEKDAKSYKTRMRILIPFLGLILFAFTAFLITSSIKKHYWQVIIPIAVIVATIYLTKWMIYYFS